MKTRSPWTAAPAFALALALLHGAASLCLAAAPQKHFQCNSLGYVTHWMVAGPEQAPYTGPSGSDDTMRKEGVDKTVVQAPRAALLGGDSPIQGQPWRFYQPGENFFVECTAFYHQLARLDYYAWTELNVEADVELPAKLWVVGQADLWVNGEHACRSYVRRDPEATAVALKLKRGVNSLCVRLQGVGIRDTNMLFGLQLLKGQGEVAVTVPAPGESLAQLVDADQWLQSVKAEGKDALAAAGPAPENAYVTNASISHTSGQSDPKYKVLWPKRRANRIALDPARSFQVAVTMYVAGQKLERKLEIPANMPAAPAPGATLEAHRRMILERIGDPKRPTKDAMQILARRMLGWKARDEGKGLDEILKGIDGRKDCSDFALACMLRMQLLGLATPEESAKIKRTALRFRYWNDEPGKDAMCFGSENHSLLFHGCQYLAGRLWPEEVFSNSKRTGREQEAIGLGRILDWLNRTEKTGYVEYLSSTYMPLTVAAILNVVDFSDDPAVSRRAAALIDRVYHDLAIQAFDSVTVGPQGRVYRNVLYPQNSGTQALLAYASTDAAVAFNNWTVFLASSKTYQPPRDLAQTMKQPADRKYRHHVAEIVVNKTADYLLTSLQIPASFTLKGKNGKAVSGQLAPGGPGYQQHLWHATLGRDCHIFVNNPGGSFDESEHRPGYWYGNWTLPRLAQDKGMLTEVFNLPETNPFPFTHAHWPADAFDKQSVQGHWAFGRKGDGCVALWCSETLQPWNDVLSGRELRAWGRQAGWLCLCGSAKSEAEFEAFIKRCQALAPALDSAKMEIRLAREQAAAAK